MKCLHAIVFGEVQGVNFRYYTKREAEKLGLKGYVKNLSDGNVEVFAQGELSKLKELLKWLHRGPTMASVDNVEVEWIDAGELKDGFRIDHSPE